MLKSREKDCNRIEKSDVVWTAWFLTADRNIGRGGTLPILCIVSDWRIYVCLAMMDRPIDRHTDRQTSGLMSVFLLDCAWHIDLSVRLSVCVCVCVCLSVCALHLTPAYLPVCVWLELYVFACICMTLVSVFLC